MAVADFLGSPEVEPVIRLPGTPRPRRYRAKPPIAHRERPQVVTIEKTGKGLKAIYAVVVLTMMGCLFLIVIGVATQSSLAVGIGALGLMLSVVGWIFTKVAIWWNHG